MTDMPTLGTVSRLSERTLDSAVGGASLAIDAARDKGKALRRGRRVNAKVAGTVETAVGETISIPERVLFSGLRALRSRAGHSDVAGTTARTLLLLVHRPAGSAARVLKRIERETAPPARRGRRAAASSRPATSSRTATGRRTTAPATRRSTTTTGTRRATSGRRGTGRTRRTA